MTAELELTRTTSDLPYEDGICALVSVRRACKNGSGEASRKKRSSDTATESKLRPHWGLRRIASACRVLCSVFLILRCLARLPSAPPIPRQGGVLSWLAKRPRQRSRRSKLLSIASDTPAQRWRSSNRDRNRREKTH